MIELGDEKGLNTLTLLDHHGSRLRALVRGTKLQLAERVGTSCVAEIGYQRLLAWHMLPDYDDEDSCILQSNLAESRYIIRGRVFHIIPIDHGESIVDLYLMRGPEFVCFSTRDLSGFVPSIEVGIEIEVEELCFYPAVVKGDIG